MCFCHHIKYTKDEKERKKDMKKRKKDSHQRKKDSHERKRTSGLTWLIIYNKKRKENEVILVTALQFLSQHEDTQRR